MTYTNSSLVDMTLISPNRNSPRNHSIDTITIHCYVGQVGLERSLSGGFQKYDPVKGSSCNYTIATDGRVGLCVEEKDRSWCSGNGANDNRAITIECACDSFHPYAVNEAVYNKLILLCADICKRNGIAKLVWSNDKNQRMNHLNGCNMTVHRDYEAKSCPGDYLYQRMGEIAEQVNKILDGGEIPMPDKINVHSIYCVKNTQKTLPEVIDKNDYAGVFGKPIEAVAVKMTHGTTKYRVHLLGENRWLPEVSGYGWNDQRNGFAGIFGKTIDAIMIKNDTTRVHYQVHCNGRWLPEVSGYDSNDKENGYAGIIGKEIDGIYVWADAITEPETPSFVEATPISPPTEETPVVPIEEPIEEPQFQEAEPIEEKKDEAEQTEKTFLKQIIESLAKLIKIIENYLSKKDV